jgi:hypothetical protein
LFARALAGPGSVVGSVLLRDALDQLDAQTRATVLKGLAGVLPQVVQPGKVGRVRTLRPDDLAALIPGAAVSAAGLNPASTPSPPPAVLWSDGGNQLLVQIAGVQARLGTGFIELSIPVSCDQTGDTQVSVTVLTGTPELPTGGVSTTEDHPRGPSVIVENWHDALIAFAWQTILIATSAVAGAVGTDTNGAPLITQGLTVTADGLSVRPMAQHLFAQTNQLP